MNEETRLRARHDGGHALPGADGGYDARTLDSRAVAEFGYLPLAPPSDSAAGETQRAPPGARRHVAPPASAPGTRACSCCTRPELRIFRRCSCSWRPARSAPTARFGAPPPRWLRRRGEIFPDGRGRVVRGRRGRRLAARVDVHVGGWRFRNRGGGRGDARRRACPGARVARRVRALGRRRRRHRLARAGVVPRAPRRPERVQPGGRGRVFGRCANRESVRPATTDRLESDSTDSTHTTMISFFQEEHESDGTRGMSRAELPRAKARQGG